MATRSDESASESELSMDYTSSRHHATRTSSRTGAIVESTAWLAPDKPARRGPDGKYVRPTGRPPMDGYSWNNIQGVWVPGKRLLREMEAQLSQGIRKRPPKRRGEQRQPLSHKYARRKNSSSASQAAAAPSPSPATDLDEYMGSDLDLNQPNIPPERRKFPPPARATENTDSGSEKRAKTFPNHSSWR